MSSCVPYTGLGILRISSHLLLKTTSGVTYYYTILQTSKAKIQRDEVTNQDLNPGLSDSKVCGLFTIPHQREHVRVSINKKVKCKVLLNREEELKPLKRNIKVEAVAHPENKLRAHSLRIQRGQAYDF